MSLEWADDDNFAFSLSKFFAMLGDDEIGHFVIHELPAMENVEQCLSKSQLAAKGL